MKKKLPKKPKAESSVAYGSKLIGAIAKLKTITFWATLICGASLFFATIVGAFLVDINTTAIATWCFGALIAIFAIFFIISTILFLIWLLPRPLLALLIAGVAVAIALLLFVYPDSVAMGLDQTLMSLYDAVKDLIKPVLNILDGVK